MFPLRARAILDLFTWVLFYLYCGYLLGESGNHARRAFSASFRASEGKRYTLLN